MTPSRRTVRTLAAAVGAAGCLLLPAGPAAAADAPPIPAGLPHLTVPPGGTVTGPTRQHYPAVDEPAGSVCPFAVHESFPVSDVVAWTYSDATGRAVAAFYTGPLVMQVTREDTGATVTADISGDGVGVFRRDGSSVLYGLGPFASNQHPGDRPGPELAVLHGFSALAIAADGRKTIRFSTDVENVCTELG